MKTTAQFERKASELDVQPCIIEVIHELLTDEYLVFAKNMLNDYEFIRAHQDVMRVDRDGVTHCMLVMGAGLPDGVLINSEGSAYGRYTAILPNARLIVETERRSKCMKILEKRLSDACVEVECCALAYDDTNPYRALLSDLVKVHGFEEAYIPLFLAMLSERSEGFTFEVDNDELIVYRNEMDFIYDSDGDENPVMNM